MAVSVAPAADALEAIDGTKMFGFLNRVLDDMSAAVVSIACTLGDRLGLFKALAAGGPATSAELAERAAVDERYTREWLSVVTTAGYVEFDPESGRFTLPPEHAIPLAFEGGPMFMGGAYQLLAGLFGPLDELTRAFRDGGGVREDTYPPDLRDGMERMSSAWFEHLLPTQWIGATPEVRAKLERGAAVADVGCGAGRALISLARRFPASSYVGYDVYAPALEKARATAEQAGVADRVRFEERDAAQGLPDRYDLVTTFDVLHDLPDPTAALRAIRGALKPDGAFLLLESNCSERLEENRGPAATILYGTSLLFCTPTSREAGGEGLGTMGLPEPKVRALCGEAGFSSVTRLPVDNPFNVLYEARP